MRLDLAAIAARVQSQTGIATGTGLDRDFLSTFGKTLPKVWILAQRLRPINDGRVATGVFRQRIRVEILIKATVARYAPGVVSADLDSEHDAVVAALINWTPDGASEPLAMSATSDAEPNESFLATDILFETEVIYEP